MIKPKKRGVSLKKSVDALFLRQRMSAEEDKMYVRAYLQSRKF